jgi:hypothetical protein
MPDKDADDPAPAKVGGGTGALTSGCDGDGQKSRRPDFPGNGLAVGLKTCDVNLDGLHGPLPALLDRAAPGKAARQGRDGHEVAAVLVGFHTIV